VAWLVCYPFVIIVSQLMAILIVYFDIPQVHEEQVAVKYLRMTKEYPDLKWAMVGLVIFVIPWLEEYLFRGFLQGYLRQHLGRVLAIVIASIIFALFHYSASQGFGNVELLLALFVLACFLGFLFERQRSLWAPYALHATFNGLSVLAILAQ
jgi:membrane protease YdiL (CAAX protease family)